MLFLKLLKRDIKYGTIKQLFKLIPIVVVVVFMFIKWDMYLDYLAEQGHTITERSLMECVMFMFEGMAVYSFDPKAFFNPPLIWIVFNVTILYFTAYYPHRDCDYYGKTIFMATKSRTQWWISKMVWCCISVIVCYLATFICIFAGTVLKGYRLSFNTNTDFLLSQYGNGIRYLNKSDVFIVVIILPVVVSITLCELQMLMSFILTPVISFALMVGLIVISSFYTVWWLLPNFTMWRRSAFFDYKGVLPSSGLILSGYLLLAVFLLGISLFKQKDIL